MATAYPPYSFNPSLLFGSSGPSASSFPPALPTTTSSFLYDPNLASSSLPWDFSVPSPSGSSPQSPFAFNIVPRSSVQWPSAYMTTTNTSASATAPQDDIASSPFSEASSVVSGVAGESDHEQKTSQTKTVNGGGSQDKAGKKKRKKVEGGSDEEDEEDRDKRDRRMSAGSVGSGDGEGKG